MYIVKKVEVVGGIMGCPSLCTQSRPGGGDIFYRAVGIQVTVIPEKIVQLVLPKIMKLFFCFPH